MAYDLWQARGRAAVIAVERFVSAGSSNRHETIWHEAFRRLTRVFGAGAGCGRASRSLRFCVFVP